MKVITDDHNKQEAELDRIVGSLDEISQAGKQKFGGAVQSRVDRLSELLNNLKLLTSQSETISLIKAQLGLNSNESFSSQQNEEVKATELSKKESVDSQFNILTRLSCFVLVYPEITPSEESLVHWIIQEFTPQLVWDKKIQVVWEKQENDKSI